MGVDEQAGRGARRRRWLLLAPLALIPAVPVIIGIVLGLGEPGAGVAPASAGSAFTPVPSHPSAPPKRPASPALQVPPGPGAIVALVLHPTTLRAAPHGRRLARLNTR